MFLSTGSQSMRHTLQLFTPFFQEVLLPQLNNSVLMYFLIIFFIYSIQSHRTGLNYPEGYYMGALEIVLDTYFKKIGILLSF